LCDGRFNLQWFETPADARQVSEVWPIDRNASRPHLTPGNIPPIEYPLQDAIRRGSMPSTSAQIQSSVWLC
jgi:hypothetical protein